MKKSLNYFVDATNVKDIHNRFTKAEDGTNVTYQELVWKSDAATTIIPLDKVNTNVKVDNGDDRQTKNYILQYKERLSKLFCLQPMIK